MRVLTRNAHILLITAILFLLCFSVASIVDASMQEIIWKDVSSGGITDSDLQTVAVSPDNADVVYTGSSNAVYKTTDGGKSWVEVLSFRGTGNSINSIAINPLNTKVIYAGTQDGLFRSKNKGTNWKRIFSGIGESRGSILHVAINPANPEVIFAGTEAGLFRTDSGGSDWSKGRNLSSEAEVSFIAIDHSRPHIVYAATDRGLYKSTNSGIDWNRVLETNIPEDNGGENTSNQVETEEASAIRAKIRGIVIDPANTGTIYVGTSEGLFVTEDSGLTWETVSSSGLISRDIHHLVISPADPDGVYAATSRGVFRYSKVSGAWSELYKGIASTDIRFLAIVHTVHNEHPTLWAATKRGVFKTVPTMHDAIKNREVKAEEVLSIFADEPSIKEIQKAAIRYAEVHPEKIEEWRKAASKKAWLPDLRVEYDKDKDWQSSDYFYSGTYRGDDITRGKDWGWSISLTWELGDLIWNDDQTSIDTRSRLMVQLRDDVLNEVTRLYFERRRLQIDMLLSPPKEIKDRAEKELRLQELTADIDALTGFYLSRSLGQINANITR